MEKDGTFDLLPKKEVILLKKEAAKLEKNLGGIKEMRRLPSALFVVDPKAEHNAVAEARILGIPVFGIVDTNCDPDEVDYVIPANDDAIRAVKLIVAAMADAICEAKSEPLTVAYVKDEDEKEMWSTKAKEFTPQIKSLRFEIKSCKRIRERSIQKDIEKLAMKKIKQRESRDER